MPHILNSPVSGHEGGFDFDPQTGKAKAPGGGGGGDIFGDPTAFLGILESLGLGGGGGGGGGTAFASTEAGIRLQHKLNLEALKEQFRLQEETKKKERDLERQKLFAELLGRDPVRAVVFGL